MFTLATLDTSPPESLKSQVLQMVVDYFSDVSPVPLTPSNPLFQLYQYVIGRCTCTCRPWTVPRRAARG